MDRNEQQRIETARIRAACDALRKALVESTAAAFVVQRVARRFALPTGLVGNRIGSEALRQNFDELLRREGVGASSGTGHAEQRPQVRFEVAIRRARLVVDQITDREVNVPVGHWLFDRASTI